MKIYFAGSIRGGREDVELYSQIIKHLQKYGEVLTEHVADPNLMEVGEQNLSEKEIHNRDMAWLTHSDVIVAEVSVPSLGVGYEIKAAIELKKKVLCLYRPQKNRNLSAMIMGCGEVSIGNYHRTEEAFQLVDNFLKEDTFSLT